MKQGKNLEQGSLGKSFDSKTGKEIVCLTQGKGVGKEKGNRREEKEWKDRYKGRIRRRKIGIY